MVDRLHSALRTEVVRTEHARGFVLTLIKLQHGKESITHSLHVVPNLWSTYGMQGSDVLAIAGLFRSTCTFVGGECFVREVPSDFDVAGFGNALAAALEKLKAAHQHLEHCGLELDQPQGWGFFFGRGASTGRTHRSVGGDGHTAAKVERMKTAEDGVFEYVLSWIDNGGDPKGWTIHYRPQNPPLSPELQAAMNFVGKFQSFSECPEFEFEPCEWRHVTYEAGQTPFDSNAGYVHESFGQHPAHFAPGLHDLLDAHQILQPYGSSFLTIPRFNTANADVATSRPAARPSSSPASRVDASAMPDNFDVAISFAGPQRPDAEKLAHLLRSAGVSVFYDNFYPEHLWGKDLVVFFAEIYRKRSRFCVMFVSRAYVDRMWTNHERRSAQARALEEKGSEYILPIRVEDVEVPGLAPTTGHLSLDNFTIEQIAELLIKKLLQGGSAPPNSAA